VEKPKELLKKLIEPAMSLEDTIKGQIEGMGLPSPPPGPAEMALKIADSLPELPEPPKIEEVFGTLPELPKPPATKSESSPPVLEEKEEKVPKAKVLL